MPFGLKRVSDRGAHFIENSSRVVTLFSDTAPTFMLCLLFFGGGDEKESFGEFFSPKSYKSICQNVFSSLGDVDHRYHVVMRQLKISIFCDVGLSCCVPLVNRYEAVQHINVFATLHIVRCHQRDRNVV